MTEGYSGGDIRDLFQSTQLRVVRNFFTHGNVTDLNSVPDAITMEDFQSIITGRSPTVSPGILKRYYHCGESFKERKGIATYIRDGKDYRTLPTCLCNCT